MTQKLSILIVLTLLFSITGGVISAQESDESGNRTHTVEAGENLSAIADFYNVSVEAIVAANGLQSANRIRRGQVLIIPPEGALPNQVATTYTVQPGDTLESIANRYNTTVEAIAQINGIISPSFLQVGRELTLPATGGPILTEETTQRETNQAIATPATTVQPTTAVPAPLVRQVVNGRYTVQAGDTMFAIGRSFNVDVWSIARANGILNLNLIYVGQSLIIPGR